MELIRSLGIAGWAWRDTTSVLFDSSIWGPLLLAALVRGAALVLLAFFYHPAVAALGGPLVEALGGPEATRYPAHLYALPDMFRQLDTGIAVLVSSVAIGVATLRFVRAYGWDPGGNHGTIGVRAVSSLVLLALLAVGIQRGTEVLFEMIPEDVRLKSVVIRLGLAGTGLLIFILVRSFLAYATAWVVLRGHPAWTALRDSVRMTSSTFLPTLLLVAVPAGLPFPFAFALHDMDLSQSQLPPEVMGSILAMQLLVEFVLSFLWVGSITRVFVWRMEAFR